MEAATATRAPGREALDSAELAKQAEEIRGADGLGDDGLGATPPADPPPADPPEPEDKPPVDPPAADPAGSGGQPPTPPAVLPDDDPGGSEEDAPAAQLFVSGERAIGVKVGGRKPDSSSLKLKGGKIDLAGQFDRGDRLIAVATLQVTGDNDQDTIEKASGVVKSTSKVQHATLCGFSRIEDYIAERIEDPKLRNEVLEALDLVDDDAATPAE